MKQFISWIIKIVALVVLTTGIWYVNGLVREKKVQVFLSEQQLDQKSELSNQALAIKQEIKKQTADLDQIASLTPPNDQLNVFIAQIGDEARRQGIDLTVPVVEEDVVINESGQRTEASGPIVNVKLKLVGTGSPAALVQFLHVMETEPYLIVIQGWHITSDTNIITTAGSLNAPLAPNEVGKQVNGSLDANMIISVANPQWHKNQ
jgi:hypothetical protein